MLEPLAIFLAQQSGSGVDNFIDQIMTLLIFIVIAFILWISLMILVVRRAAERRRRREDGEPPLPGLLEQAQTWFQEQFGTPPADEDRNRPLEEDVDFDLGLPLPDVGMPDGYSEGEPEPPTADAESSLQEVMRIWRNLNDGELVVEINEKRFATLEQLHASNLAYRYINIVEDLLRIAEQPHEDSRSVPQVPAPAPISANIETETKDEDTPDAPPTIADQIEAYLQPRLQKHPTYHGRDIHVRPSADGGVDIVVDHKIYREVDAIEDAHIRTFLQAIIQEWSEQQ